MSQKLPDISRWTIQETDHEASFPKGARQTLSHLQEDAYELKWEVLSPPDRYVIRLSPLYLKGNRLINPNVRARVNRKTVGYYNVSIDLQSERFHARSVSVEGPVRGATVPGPLVGQWGAESVPPAAGEGNPK